MLNTAKTLKGYTLSSRDGDIGKVKEFYFDDQHWTIRYLVADTGNWLTDRQVLISPYALGAVNTDAQSIAVDLTKQQIEDSPSLTSDKPVSRQFEETYTGYYGMPTYWGGPYMWGAYPYLEHDRNKWGDVTPSSGITPSSGVTPTSSGVIPSSGVTPSAEAWDSHLRSTHDVSGHHIQATDDEIGHVEDFIIDDETWAIRYLIIDTRNWWPGKNVLVAPQWIERVSWNESKVFVNLPRETIKQSPEYTKESLLNREYETKLYGYYNRQGYWVESAAK